jgi:FixJ family two-component response regulator
MRGCRSLIAVVDDEESVRKALCRLFAASDLDSRAFASGREFLDSLRSRVPDCVVLDLHMPGLTGLDVQRELRNRRLRVPAIIITAYDEPETRSQCLSAGATAYLRKPLEEKTLMDVVMSALEGER